MASITVARKASAKPKRLDPVLAVAGDLDQRQLALERPALRGEVGDRMDRHQALKLVLDLGQHHRRAGGHDGDPRQVLGVLGLRDGQALDVVAAAGEQADDPGQHARLVVDEDRKRVPLQRGRAAPP